MKKTVWRIISFILVLTMFATFFTVLPPEVNAEQPDTISVENGNIEVTVSTKNGGFLIRTQEGDIITKDDDNKELLYRNDSFDTSFTSFKVTEGNKTKEYIFGNNYSFLGLGGNDLKVVKEGTGIKAVWSADNLIFTQLLEPVASESSNEHGTVKISYSVVNKKGTAVSVKARLLLDTALGKQDYGSYELAKSATAGGGYDLIEKECIISKLNGDYIPANFFCYDNYENPAMAAYTIQDESENAVKPYLIAFGHWRNLASTVFNFAPDEDLTFTNANNKEYLTADSAFALYFDMGTVKAGNNGNTISTYYGVNSNIRVKDSDRVGITVTSPISLALSEDKKNYLDPETSKGNGTFEITTNITNLKKKSAKKFEKIAVAILVDDGLTPLDSGGNELAEKPDNKYPYTVEMGNFDVSAVRQLVWKLKADVLPVTGYRKIVFRVYDMSDSKDGLLVLDNLIGSSTTYILCPGGDGKLPQITFTGAGPKTLYNQGTRHLYLTGTGFDLLKAAGNYELRAYLKSDRSIYYVIPATNIVFPPEAGVLDIVLEGSMPTGEYELVFEWQTPPAGIDKSMTAPALSFIVTADQNYRNDYYNVVAIVKDGSGENIKYAIKTFADEEHFAAFKGEVLLVLKGEFTVESEKDGEIKACSAVSTSNRDTININGALDFEKGNVQIYQDTSGGNDYIMAEFNGDLYTTNSRTAVWSGNASITPLNNGSDYGLIKYDESGERIFGKQPQNIISLVWPSGYNMLQTIGGLAVDFRYGQFGAMYTGADYETCTGYVVSFGGKLDISFLMPGGVNQAQKLEREEYEKNQYELEAEARDDGSLYQRTNDYSPSDEAKAEDEKNKVKPVGKVNIEDVLFGKNKGYLGFNSEVELMLPKYIDALPVMGGKLDINTIGGYAIGVQGMTKTRKFEMDFELNVKSAPDSQTPVPDKIYFYMDGFEPGVNIDSAGAVWITGLGGGIDRLYDSIFSSGGITPATLLLSASFDIMKVMSGKGDLALSLCGFQIKLRDVKLKNTDDIVIDNGQLAVEWSPDFYLQLSSLVNLYDVIDGKAYIVVDKDFFELFLRASIKVPDKIKIIGGMDVGNVDMGGNNEKIWGVISALGIKLGVTYYWGGDIHFGSGTNTTNPTYPELLGYEDIPVGVSTNTGKTLYMEVGTNLSEGTKAQLVKNSDGDGLMLMSADPTLTSDLEKKKHSLNLGSDTGDDAALTIRFTGNTRPKTIAEAQAAINVKKPDGSKYDLNFYSGSNPDTANANLMTDDKANTTTVGMTITDYIAGDWSIDTAQEADIVLYSVGAVPEVTSFTAKQDPSGELYLSWEGSKLDETKLSFYVTKDSGEIGTLIGSIGGTYADGSPKTAPLMSGQSVSFSLPADLQSGDYNVRMIASKEDQVNQTVMAFGDKGSFVLHHINSDQPDAPEVVSLQNCGSNMLKLTVGTPPAGFDGYMVNIYEKTADGTLPTDFMGITFDKNEAGGMMLGGNYTTTEGKTYGLTGGKNYIAAVSAYKINDGNTPEDKTDDVMVLSTETATNAVKLKAATPPVITFKAEDGICKTIPQTVKTGDNTEKTVNMETFTTNDVSFTLKSDVPVTGYWSIDGMLSQNLLDSSSTGITNVIETNTVNISRNLCDGEHTVSFTGTDAEGDSFNFTKIIAVDTKPPRLMLTSPTNGSFFSEDGKLLIKGLGDENALYTIVVDGATVVNKKTLASLGAAPDPYGLFSYTLPVDPGVSSHQVMIIAADAAGNSTYAAANVKNIGLASIESIGILKGNVAFSNKNVILPDTGNLTVKLQLFATTKNNNQFVINDENLVKWTSTAKKGSAVIDQDGSLTVQTGSVGFAEGALRVSESASMSASVTFGAEIYSGGQNYLILASTIGGTVKGEGAYLPGTKVTLTATPASGYKFYGWSSSDGGNFSSTTAAVTTFTMPKSSTVVTARFSLISTFPPISGSSSDSSSSAENTVNAATAGSVVSIPLSDSLSADPNTVVPYYKSGGKEKIVSVSNVVDGKLVFIAPIAATYYAKQNRTDFIDTKNHWAKEAIEFTTARNLFKGIGNKQFDPGGKMTRAMFVSVIARLDGVDLTQYGNSKFLDVPAGSWYSKSVEWANKAKIVNGISNTKFSPNTAITREQMAVMLNNYLIYKNYKLKTPEKTVQQFNDNDSISSLAQRAVDKIHSYGIIRGKTGNLFDPKQKALRCECSLVFERLIKAIIAR